MRIIVCFCIPPRRWGKSSLVRESMKELVEEDKPQFCHASIVSAILTVPQHKQTHNNECKPKILKSNDI